MQIVEYFSSKVECAGCCLANDYCVAFSWEILSGICHFTDSSHANIVYGKNADDKEGLGRIEVYRDETFLQDVCFKKGLILLPGISLLLIKTVNQELHLILV